jgi:hypothetical protein
MTSRESPQLHSDYEGFLAAGDATASTTLPPSLARIRGDLVASAPRLAGAYLGLATLGYVCSLALCAQNSVGVLPFSHAVAARMHVIPWPWCPVVCGALFSLVPTVFAAAFFTRFQRRYLLRRMWWLLALVPLAASVTMWFVGERDPSEFLRGALHGDFSPMRWMLMWTVGALVTPWIVESVSALVLFRRRRYASSN